MCVFIIIIQKKVIYFQRPLKIIIGTGYNMSKLNFIWNNLTIIGWYSIKYKNIYNLISIEYKITFNDQWFHYNCSFFTINDTPMGNNNNNSAGIQISKVEFVFYYK